MNIQQVGILDFRKNIYKWIKTLPIEVVAKGETVFYVVESVDSKVDTVPNQVATVSGTETPHGIVENKIFKGKKEVVESEYGNVEWTWEWCHANKAHEFTQGKLFRCQLVTYEDKDGNIGVIAGKKYEHTYICMECLVKLEGEITEGGFNYGR
jgi:hypothetical protein